MDVCGTVLLENRQASPAVASYPGAAGRQATTNGLLRDLAFVLHATQTVRRAMHRDGSDQRG